MKMTVKIKPWILCVVIFGLFKSLSFAQSGEIPLDPKVLPTIVKIETISQLSKKQISGTGFVVGREIVTGSSTRRAYFLVTNKHMVSDWTLSDGNISNFNKFVDVYFYDSGQIAQKQPTRINLLDQQGHFRANVIYAHPDNSVDIAIIFINAALQDISGLDLPAFDVSFLCPFKAITSINFNIGSEVFVLGYPLGITSLKTHYPIAKFGFIAATPGEEFAINVKDISRAGRIMDVRLTGKLLIIDGLIMPGNSGGPVVLPSVIKTRINQETGRWEHWTKPNDNQVIGILSGNFGHSGLSYSFCSDYIVEAIDKFLSREGLHPASAWP
jgi:S1-C subfamily serine protease